MLEQLFGIHPSLWLELITVPLFTGIIGYITNWTGVLMLFKTVQFHGFRVPGQHVIYPYLPRRVQVLPIYGDGGRRLGWQGMVPSRADKMASIAVDTGLAKLGSVSDFYREMDPDKLAAHFAVLAEQEIDAIIESLMVRENPQLWANLPAPIKDVVRARVHEQLPDVSRELTQKLGENIEQLLDVKQMLIRYFAKHPELLNELFLIMGRKELTFMQNFGFYFGFPMGFVTVAILEFVVREWWVLPICGIIIGWVVNWIGVNLIFWPAVPKWWLPWRQGLLLKRQPEITALYAKMIGERVLTLENIGYELLNGPRADRTKSLLEDTLKPSVDRAMGPAQGIVRFAVGSRQYERIKSSMAPEMAALAPVVLQDETINREQARKIEAFVSERMSAMGPEDFVLMLRSAIKQDEWLLFVHGGVLGAFAGLLHLAIFGV